MAAHTITIDFFQAFCRLSQKALTTGLKLFTQRAGKYKALRSFELPILDNLAFPLIEILDWFCLGVNPAKAANYLAEENRSISGVSGRIATAVLTLIPCTVYRLQKDIWRVLSDLTILMILSKKEFIFEWIVLLILCHILRTSLFSRWLLQLFNCSCRSSKKRYIYLIVCFNLDMGV